MSRTSVFYAFDYIFSIAIFGFLFTILSLIILPFAGIVGSSDLKTFAMFMFYGSLMIFLIFGPLWFFNKLREWKGNNPGA